MTDVTVFCDCLFFLLVNFDLRRIKGQTIRIYNTCKGKQVDTGSFRPWVVLAGSFWPGSFLPWVVLAGSFWPGSFRPYLGVSRFGVSTQLQSSCLVAHENSTFRNSPLAVSGPFMA